jgi:flavin reductase (DIM6/NTAB) family NADH-FMN oxidoreductase RutF
MLVGRQVSKHLHHAAPGALRASYPDSSVSSLVTASAPALDHLDPAILRRVFGAFPTGVVAVAALVGGAPTGLAANSFTSVSLRPPLVSVCIAHSSTTWPLLSHAPRIGISVLSAQQIRHGRQLAAHSSDRFVDVHWRQSRRGAVFIEEAAAWLDTSVETHVEIGDHDIVVLRVHDLGVDHEVHPLVFHGSRFRKLAPVAAADNDPDLE